MFNLFYLAWLELVANKTRSILTALGIIIGVCSVNLIIGTGDIARAYLLNTFFSFAGNPKLVRINSTVRADVAKMTIRDYEYLKSLENIYDLSDINPDYVYSLANLENFEKKTVSQTITGTYPKYYELFADGFSENFQGRFFSETEVNSVQNVAVVSRSFIRNFYGKNSALNETIKLGNKNLLVIGEYDQKVDLFGGSDRVFVPLPVLWEMDDNPDKALFGLTFLVNNEAQVETVAKAIESNINEWRRSQFTGSQAKPFTLNVAAELIKTINATLIALQIFLALIAIISLLVGGIGVLNVMLMSVAQRVREIGIRRALGAKNSDILAIFLSESVLLTTISGVFGAALAQYFVFVLTEIILRFDSSLKISFSYSWFSIYLACLISALVGVIFGIYPAWQASRISIVEALRYD